MTDLKSIFFNAHHAPIGAFATFTLGCPGAKGGLGLELGAPANQNVFIGLQRRDGSSSYEALPFFDSKGLEEQVARYMVEQEERGIAEDAPQRAAQLSAFDLGQISREFAVASDTWRAGDLTFTLYSPVTSVPDPASASEEALRAALAPAVLAEITVDNTQGSTARRAFIGFSGNDAYSGMRRLDDTSGGSFCGVGQGRMLAIAARGEGVRSGLGFTLQEILAAESELNVSFGLGNSGALALDTPAGERRTFQAAIAFYRDGWATAGLDTKYFYTKLFANIEDVCDYALDNFEALRESAISAGNMLADDRLSCDQKFMMAQSIRSYYGSTQLLEQDGKPLWVVNEGEYRMMNTFDLAVDQCYFELKMNPWVVRNVLDQFVARYSYTDTVKFPGCADTHPGGISFTHDMGANNVFSRPHFSSYEKSDLRGCFSHMTQEQLVNWIVTAAVYIHHTGDTAWRDANLPIFEQCLASMANRDNPNPAERTGIMSLDSSRVGGGAEITTYDSLDASLGQARSNIYLAVKCWAGYIVMEKLFEAIGKSALAAQCRDQAARCAATLAAHAGPNGIIPAVLEEGNASQIIPAIEGLVYPYLAGCAEAVCKDGAYGKLIGVLRAHFEAVLVPGVCLFDDGGWKLSSTANNSWLSKIYLCQYVARQVLGIDNEKVTASADAAHVGWLTSAENGYWAWSDQMVSGIAVGSRYYPRGVTSILWLDEDHRGAAKS